jgi:RNA polymerase sigma factor (sigma-70 family)
VGSVPNRRLPQGRVLSEAEEGALARQIEAGVLAREALDRAPECRAGADRADLLALVAAGEQARQLFVTSNLGLVAMVTSSFASRSSLNRCDLFQEGCLGLLQAVQRFDHDRGVRFATYALFWIRAYVGAASARAIAGNTLPTDRAEQLRSLRGVESALAQSLGRTATTREVAGAVGRSVTWTAQMASHQTPQRIDDVDPGRLVSDDEDAIAAILDADRPGRELLWHLDPLERRVLELRMGFETGRTHSYAETARVLDTSTARVRRVEQRGLERLREVCPQAASIHL